MSNKKSIVVLECRYKKGDNKNNMVTHACHNARTYLILASVTSVRFHSRKSVCSIICVMASSYKVKLSSCHLSTSK